jgi:hypothetical protein
MDAMILGASLISFFVLIGSWLTLPASNTETVSVPAGAAVRA